jgi:hypothetical protein
VGQAAGASHTMAVQHSVLSAPAKSSTAAAIARTTRTMQGLGTGHILIQPRCTLHTTPQSAPAAARAIRPVLLIVCRNAIHEPFIC